MAPGYQRLARLASHSLLGPHASAAAGSGPFEVPATMAAIVVQAEGKLRFERNAPTPQPAANQVLIKVHGSSVNPVDWKIVNMLEGVRPGFDLSGVIVAVGSGVTSGRLKVGDEVWADNAPKNFKNVVELGACAQYRLGELIPRNFWNSENLLW